MFLKKIRFILIITLFYQTPLFSKSASLNDFNAQNLSEYFSGIVAFENKDNAEALEFFNSSRILIENHDPYLKRYLYSLVLENKINKAINLVKSNKERENTNFFDAHLLLVLDNLKKGDFKKAYDQLNELTDIVNDKDRFNLAILESLRQYIYVFKEKVILNDKKSFGKLSIISETLQRCYLGDFATDAFFSELINDKEGNFIRYIFFYLVYLTENNRINDVKNFTNNLDYLNTTLLISQAKSWVENGNYEKLTKFFSCKNPNDIIGEFLFLVSNLYSSQDNFEKSNFYLNLSNFFNQKFIFNLSLVAENQYLNKEYNKAKRTLKNFRKDNDFYYWYRIKKETQIIEKEKNKEESLNYIISQFDKINKPNNKILFDIANFYKNSKKYEEAIEYYTKLINSLDDNSVMKSDLLYRRGGSYERSGDYEKADRDLLDALNINSDDAYILNYLAYSWLERDYKIDEAIDMLEKAYKLENNDPYIIDSIGWAYYLVNDYLKAEKFIKRAVELMPEDPIVNDHYGDILWMLDRKIQARYFWSNVLKMESTETEMIENINKKMIDGLQNS